MFIPHYGLVLRRRLKMSGSSMHVLVIAALLSQMGSVTAEVACSDSSSAAQCCATSGVCPTNYYPQLLDTCIIATSTTPRVTATATMSASVTTPSSTTYTSLAVTGNTTLGTPDLHSMTSPTTTGGNGTSNDSVSDPPPPPVISGKPVTGLVLCKKCNELCEMCNGSGVANCTECSKAKSNGTCVVKCPDGQKPNGNKLCVPIESGDSFPVAAVAGGAAGGLVIIVIVVILLICCIRKRRQRQTIHHQMSKILSRRDAELKETGPVLAEEGSTPPSPDMHHPVYENYGFGHMKLRDEIPKGADNVLRYTKDPTIIKNNPGEDSPTYGNSAAAVWNNGNREAANEEAELQRLGQAPAPPISKMKTGSKGKKRATVKSVPDQEQYIDMDQNLLHKKENFQAIGNDFAGQDDPGVEDVDQEDYENTGDQRLQDSQRVPPAGQDDPSVEDVDQEDYENTSDLRLQDSQRFPAVSVDLQDLQEEQELYENTEVTQQVTPLNEPETDQTQNQDVYYNESENESPYANFSAIASVKQ